MGSAPGIPTTAIRQTENALVDLLGSTVRDVLRSQIAPVKEPDMPPRPLPQPVLPFTALAVVPSVALAAAAVAFVVAASTAFAQTAEGPSFTAEQVERGRAAYNQNCQDCHGSTADNGEFRGPPAQGGYF